MGLVQHPGTKPVCTFAGKDRLTKSQAKSAAKRMQRETGNNVTAYQCRICTSWHVGWLRHPRKRSPA